MNIMELFDTFSACVFDVIDQIENIDLSNDLYLIGEVQVELFQLYLDNISCVDSAIILLENGIY